MLSAVAVSKAVPKEKEYLLPDSDHLYLRVRPSGSKNWVVRYMVNRKQSKKIIGAFPEMTLAQARVARDKFLAAVHSGDVTGGTLQTFGEIAEAWLKRKAPHIAEKTALIHRQRLDMYILPKLQNADIKTLRRPVVLKVAADLADDGREEMARRVAQIIEGVFAFAVDVGVLEYSPAADLSRGLPKRSKPIEHFKAATTDDDIAALMRALETINSTQARCALKLVAYTGLRIGSLLKAEWSEINIDRCEWIVPQEHMKMGKALYIPCSRQVLDLLHDVQAFNAVYAPASKMLFPTLYPNERSKRGASISEVALLRTLKNLCWSCHDCPAVSIHGFRKTMSSVLNGHGWNADAIERQLAHVSGGVRGIYNLAEYLDIRRPMLQWYADYLDALRDGVPLPPIHK